VTWVPPVVGPLFGDTALNDGGPSKLTAAVLETPLRVAVRVAL
jgi:hypothetical protein